MRDMHVVFTRQPLMLLPRSGEEEALVPAGRSRWPTATPKGPKLLCAYAFLALVTAARTTSKNA